MKKTEGTTAKTETPAKAEPRNPAEMELDRLRIELHNEKIKTDALSRRCIRLGEALDAAISAEDNRVEANVFGIINKNSVRREAADIAKQVRANAMKRRRIQQENAAERYEKACKRNALSLCTATVIGFGAVIFGYAGFIHTALASTIAGASLIAFGWALNTCVNLLGRCEQ